MFLIIPFSVWVGCRRTLLLDQGKSIIPPAKCHRPMRTNLSQAYLYHYTPLQLPVIR